MVAPLLGNALRLRSVAALACPCLGTVGVGAGGGFHLAPNNTHRNGSTHTQDSERLF